MPQEHIVPCQDAADEELWQDFVDGEDAALQALMERHSGRLWWYLLLSTGRGQPAAAHLARTWELVAGHRCPFEGWNSFKGWLYAVATQNCVPANQPESMGITELMDDFRRGAPDERRDEIFFRVGDLRPHLRQPFLLTTVAGLDVAQAARACNFTEERTVAFLEKAYRRLARSTPFRDLRPSDEV